MTLALLVPDIERGLTVVHSLYLSREPWMTRGYDVRDVSDVPGIAEGWLVDADGTYSAPEEKAQSAPQIISDRQFFQQLAVDGDITQDEALAAVTTGELPKKLSDVIAKLPTESQFAARMLASGATQFERTNSMVAVLGKALGKDAAALDAVWLNASKL